MLNADLQRLVGRTVTKARMDDAVGEHIDGSVRAYGEWGYRGGDVELTFDDGTVLFVASDGYDAYATLPEIKDPEIEEPHGG